MIGKIVYIFFLKDAFIVLNLKANCTQAYLLCLYYVTNFQHMLINENLSGISGGFSIPLP